MCFVYLFLSIGNVSMGLIGLNTHAVQEKNWGNRFIEKSAMDKNKYSISADLGIGFSRLLKENINSGSHSILWDAEKNNSGIYIIKMIVGDAIHTQKVVLVK